MDEIVDLMRQDPPVTAEVLRRCNSSFFGNEKPVADVYEAVFRMGFYEVYRITVALFGLQAMSMAKVAKCIQAEAIWRHSAITAIAGGVVARELGESEGLVFTAGLLHDVGKIVLALKEGDRYGELLQQHTGSGSTLNEAEQARFGVNHGELGASLLNRWGMPEEVFVPVLGHHEVSWSGPFERLAAIVNLANLMAHCLEKTSSEKPCELSEAVHAMQLLGLKNEDMPALELQSRSDIKRMSSLLSPHTPR
jgi:putative nucleotidyltransferase with HDIG domain